MAQIKNCGQAAERFLFPSAESVHFAVLLDLLRAILRLVLDDRFQVARIAHQNARL